MADQLVPMLTGAYGHPVVQTPNLDALVRAGVRVDAAYSPSPLCTPARACLMSGAYVSTNRVCDNAAFLGHPDAPALPDERRLRLRAQRQDALRRAGPAARLRP
jgi:arylsulfatase A-like enzyme